jgi:hypothetical protein
MHSFSLHDCYMPRPSHPPSLDHSNYMWWKVPIIKLLIIQFSPTAYHFIPLRSKYSPQHPLLKYIQSISFPWCQTPSSTPIQNYTSVYFNFTFF